MSLARPAEIANGLAAAWLKLRLLLAFQPVKRFVNWIDKQFMDHYFTAPAPKTVSWVLGTRKTALAIR